MPDAGRSVVGGAHRLTQFRNNNNSENKNIARVVAAPPDEADAAESVVARHKHFSTTAFADDYVGAADAGESYGDFPHACRPISAKGLERSKVVRTRFLC